MFFTGIIDKLCGCCIYIIFHFFPLQVKVPCFVTKCFNATDEMGLGKTVELLACIFAHRRSAYGSNILIDPVPQVNGDQKVTLKRLKRERVECICGAVSESLKYQGLWVQCDICDAWQHADCVGYSPKGKSLKSKQGCESKTYKTTIFERDGEYVCQMCSELIQATESPIASGATLIVCPAPILPQWHDEIIRYSFLLMKIMTVYINLEFGDFFFWCMCCF